MLMYVLSNHIYILQQFAWICTIQRIQFLFSDFIIQYAVWDLAFHMIPFARIDPEFAKKQLELFLSEKYMAPNGQIPGQNQRT